MTLDRLIRTLGLVTLGAGLILNSCSKDKKTPTGPAEPEEGYTLQENVHEVQEGEIAEYDTLTGNITFTDISGYNIGDIILNNNITDQNPHRFLRRIESVGGNIAETSASTPNEAVEQWYVQRAFSLVPQGPLQRTGDFAFNIPINNVILYDEDGNHSTTNDQAMLNGNLAFNTEVDLTLDVDLGGINYFAFNTSSEENLNINYTSNTTSAEISDETNIASILCQPIFFPPFYFIPRVGINAKIEGTLSNAETEVSQEANLETAMSYEDENWNHWSNFSNEFYFEIPTFSTEAELKVSVGPEIQLLAYDLAGAYIGTYGSLRANVTPIEDPWWTLYGGLESIVGATLQLWGFPIADYSIPLFEHEQILVEAEGNHEPGNNVIAFTGSFNEDNNINNFEIYTIFPDGSNLTRLTYNQSYDAVHSWNPNRNRIAFTSDRDSNDEIYTMDYNGENITRLTFNPSTDGQASWSPDGTRIAFISTRTGNSEIYTMNIDGSNIVRLTNNPDYTNNLPSWSPDGSKIAFGSDRDGNDEIYTMNLDGSNQTRLTYSQYSDSPSWNPEGNKIAFHKSYEEDFEIYTMNLDGSNQTRLTDNTSDNFSPSWSPDGTRIAFTSNRDGNREIYTMNLDGSNQTRLTYNTRLDWYPVWNQE